jgi:hypothetical protein
MRTSTLLALATTLVLGFGSAAMAGEGSPDLALPSNSAHEADPSGSNYANEPAARAFGQTYVAPRERAARVRRSEENTGQIIRRNSFEEQNGITGE